MMIVPQWVRDLNPGKVMGWVALLGMLGVGLNALRSIPGEIRRLSDQQATSDSLRTVADMRADSLLARADSLANREHAELWLEVCILRGFDTPQELRACLQ